ncbi:hypothetical protein TKK_0014423 [Trichogramma kaykai]
MYTCEHCENLFESDQQLIRHLKKLHSSSSHFTCFYESCNRVYDKFQSFLRHIINKHNLNSTHDEIMVHNSHSTRDEIKVHNLNTTHEKIAVHNNFSQNNKQTTDNSNILKLDNNECYDFESDDDYVEFDDLSKHAYNIECDNELGSNVYEWESDVKKIGLKYTATLYNMKNISRTIADKVVCMTKDLIQQISIVIKKECDTTKSESTSSNQRDEILILLQNVFSGLDTEYKRFNEYKKFKTYIAPENHDLGERIDYKNVKNVLTLVHVPINAQFIRIGLVLKNFFELPNVFDDTIAYMNDLYANKEIISNLIQAEFWQNRRNSFEDKIVIPLVLYFDDYENNNPLGPHKGVSKTGAVYSNIPCLPINYQAKLENIFVFTLFNSLDRVNFTNAVVFSKVVNEINYLNNFGIELNLPNGSKKIFFELALIVADNLGLHSMLGLVESFNSSIFCQHCLTSQTEKSNILLENECILRTIHNYDSLLSKNNVKISGMKEKCIFHDIENFHMSQNISVDIQHDIFEGICRYDLALILNQYINVKKLFSLDDLNLRLRSYDYGKNYNINKPPEIAAKSLKNGCIIMSSAEMLCLVRNLNLMIGHWVPEDDQCWQLFLTLRELVNIVMSRDIHPRCFKALETTVFEYLSLLNDLFPGNFKPKHHFLIHYPRSMLMFGPLINICCLRFESKNREGKQASHNSSNRVNVNKTIAIKHQLYLNYRFIAREPAPAFFVSKAFPNTYSIGPQFHIVHELLLYEQEHLFITQKINDYMYIQHLQAYKFDQQCKSEWFMVNEDVMKTTSKQLFNLA